MTLSVRGDYVGGDKCNWPYDLDFSPFINGEHGMVPGWGHNEGLMAYGLEFLIY